MLGACASGADWDIDALETRLRAEGELPLRSAGRRALEKSLAEAGEAQRRAARVEGVAEDPLQLSCDADGLTLTAVATDVRADGDGLALVWVTASKDPAPSQQLVGWITLLIAVATGVGVRRAHVVGCRSAIELGTPDGAEAARAHLTALVQTWRRVRHGPLPLFPTLSRELVMRSLKDPSASPADLVERLEPAWEGAPHRAGDRNDPWVCALFGHLSVDDPAKDAAALLEAARPVWMPLLVAAGVGDA